MKNWKLDQGRLPLSNGAEALGIVAPEKRPADVLIRRVDGKCVQGNVGVIQALSQRAVEIATTLDEGL